MSKLVYFLGGLLLSLSVRAEEAASAAAAVIATPVAAAPMAAVAAAPVINTGDTAWMLISTALVLLMTPGLAFFYGGMVRSKNTLSTLMTSFVALGVISIIWSICGYSIAFAPGGEFLGGLQWAFYKGIGGNADSFYGTTIPHTLFATYQMMFAVITPALIAGAFVERMKFVSYVLFISLWSLLVYSPVAHWVWGNGGWLAKAGMLDFAGGLVVHQLAGVAALAAVMVIGKRKDYGKASYAPHNVPMIALGTALLWFGWFGFNAGSAVSSAGGLAASAFTITHLGAAAAACAWTIIDMILKGKPSVTGFCIGAVVGLVAITPASGFVEPYAAIIIGAVAGVASNIFAYLRGKSEFDDSLDVVACHGVGGFVGTILTGFFASKAVNPAGVDGSLAQVFIQLKGSIAGLLFSFVLSYIILKVIDATIGLRPSSEVEEKGLDTGEHGEEAYIYKSA
jgi:Amt family ammonium transporter